MVAIFTGAGTGFERGSGNVIGGAGLLGSAAQGRGGDNIFLNAANGNLLISRQDEFLSGRGPDLGISRTYNSLGNFSDDNGDNWRQSLHRIIKNYVSAESVTRVSADGSEILYDFNGTAYVARDGAGAYDKLTYSGTGTGDGVWTWTDGDTGVTETYAADGIQWRILSQTDTSGNSLTFSYTGADLTRVTTANGEYTELGWSGNNITQLVTGYNEGGVAKTLTRTRYGYDGYNRLSTVTVDLTPNDNSVTDGGVYTTSYTYHGTSKLVATISQTDGSYVAFTYDGSSRVDSITQAVASGVTRTTIIAYGAGTTSVTDPMGQTTTLHYDVNGQLTRITAPPATAGATPQTVHFAYNTNGDLIRSVDAGGKVTSYTYDVSGNLLTRSDAVSVAIQNGINAIATLQPDGTYRVAKTSGSSGTYDSQVQSAQGISGDFVFRLRPLQTDKYVLAGVSQNPNASLNYNNLDFAIEAAANGYMYHYDNGVYAQLTSYVAGDSLWMVRTGSTLSYYKGDTLEAAKAAGALRTVSGVSGTFYADAALYTIGTVADMSLTPTSIEESFNTVTRTYNAANQVVTETRSGSDRDSPNASHTTRYVYDEQNLLKHVVSAEGLVTSYWYNSYGARYWSENYSEYLYDVSGLSSDTALSLTQLTNWWLANPDKTKMQNVQVDYFDARGNLDQRIHYGATYADGNASTADGYTHVYYTYDQAGQLLNRRTASQNTEYFVYDGMGRITSSTDLNGGVTNIYFNDAATQTMIVLAGGLVQTSTYSKAGELLSVIEGGAYTIGGTASNVYDLNGRLRSTTDASGVTHYYLYDKLGRKTAEVNESGHLVEYRYDARNRLIATARFALGVNSTYFAALADPSSSIDVATIRPTSHSYDIWTWHVYDADGRVLQAIEGDGSATSYEYDASGQLVKTLSYYNKLSAGQISAFQVAAPTGIVLPAADPRDAVSRVFYDKDGRTIGTLDGMGYLTRVAYDRAGRKVKEVAYAKATDSALRTSGTFQQLTNSTNPNPNPANRTINYIYDGQGQLRYQIDGLGQVIEYGYESSGVSDSIGLVRKVTTYATLVDFSASGMSLAAVKATIASSGAASNAANRTSWAVYDAAGRVAYAIDAGGAVTGYSYDSSGRVTKQVQYATLRATTSVPPQADMDSWAATNPAATDRVSRYYYDAQGQLRFTIDAEGYLTRTDYDAEGRVTATVRYDNPVTANDSWTIADVFNSWSGTYITNLFYYDPAGRLTLEYDGEFNRKDYVYYATGKLAYEYTGYGTADQTWTIYVYDAAGRKTHHYAAYDTPEQALTQYVYDGLGNLVLVSDPLNRTTTYTHDSLGRVLTQTDAASGTVSYQYNAFGDVVRTTDQRGNSTYNYFDNYGRVLSSRDAENYVTETRYTAFGEIANITRRFSRATGTPSVDALPSYDAHASDATTTFAYDKLGRVTSTTDAENKTEYRNYDAFGKVVRAENKLGGVVYYSYSRRGQLTHEYVAAPIYDSIGNQVAPAYYRHVNYYDARGNLTHQIEAYVEGYDLPERRDTAFAYDKADRLISKTGGPVKTGLSGTEATPTETYAYDKRGNLIQTTDATGNRTLFYYDDLDRKIAQIDATGAVVQYIYDAAGNLKQMRAFDTLVTLPATPGGTVALPGGTARDTYYNYDNLNRLTSSYTDAGRTGYWNGSVFVTQTGFAFTYYEYDAAGNVIKTTDPNGATTFSYYDKLGRKTHEVDRENFLTKWEYDAEGNVLTERRYAIQGSTPTTAAAPVIGETASDRVTLFTYDKLGRRLTETRHGVEAWSIDVAGVLNSAPGSAMIVYTYNALGQVESKREANGDTTLYEYDNAGRLTKEARASYYDHTGTLIAPELRYFYNGLDQLTATRQTGNGSTVSDRITGNIYEDGRLTSTTDADARARNYHYDAAGRLVAESYARMLSAGYSVTEAVFYVHDAAGRVIAQTFARFDGTNWVHTDTNGQAYAATRMRYNAHGELIGRGTTASHTTGAVYQEYFDYDASGRMWRTNAGDGVLKFQLYDKAGRQTLTLTSAGADLSALTEANYTASITSTGDTNTANAVTTVTAYDKRGMVTQTRAPDRQLNATTTADVTATREYNAFGEVTKEIDTFGAITTFAYNNMGRLLTKMSPQVSVTSENGTVSTVNPTEHYRYDISGRLIGAVDANGNLTRRVLLAGTGHGGAEALAVKEIRADGSVFQTFYDRFGDARILRNELGQDEHYEYDGMGRVFSVLRRGGLLTEEYRYDGLGQRIQQWNSLQGVGARTYTDYDVQGRVISSAVIGGETTTTSYAWVFDGLGQLVGSTETTSTNADRVSGTDFIHAAIQHTDLLGRVTGRVNKGGIAYNYTFDLAGRMVTEHLGSETLPSKTYSYYNTGQIRQVFTGDAEVTNTDWSNKIASYEYDALGRLTREMLVSSFAEYTEERTVWVRGPGTSPDTPDGEGYGWYETIPESYDVQRQTLQDGRAEYDAAGRIVRYRDVPGPGYGSVDFVDKKWTYDAVGNVRSIATDYREMAASGAISVTATQQTYWYRYDSMNRLVTTKGTFTGAPGSGYISRGAVGTDITYNAAGQRATAQTGWNAQEDYAYNAAGQLTTVMNGSVLRAVTTYDALNRVTGYSEHDVWGTAVHSRHSIDYDLRGQVLSEKTSTRQGSDTIQTHTVNHYSADGTGPNQPVISYSGQTGSSTGSVLYFSRTKNWMNGGFSPVYGSSQDNAFVDSDTRQTYFWTDAAMQKNITLTNRHGSSSSTYYYDRDGMLVGVDVSGDPSGTARAHHIGYTNNLQGQIIRRSEFDWNFSQNDPQTRTYMFGGRQMGVISNDGTGNVDYNTAIAQRTAAPGNGPFRGGATSGSAYADFDSNFTAFNGGTISDGASSYLTAGGETLQSIAAQVWGDSTLWYKLAEANPGLGTGALAAGTPIRIPGGVIGNHHNADTFKPYDPAEAIGNTSPNTPKPPKKNGCGIVGQIIMMAVAIAITAVIKVPVAKFFTGLFTGSAVAGGAAAATAAVAGGIVGGTVTAAVASAGSQLFGMATGIQQGGFNWGAVGTAALSAFLGPVPVGNVAGSQFLGNVVGGALTSAVSQGIGRLVGLQKKLDWAGVATAGLSQAVTAAVGGAFKSPGSPVAQIAAVTARSVSTAAARSLIDGTSFGDNLVATLPDVVLTLGSILANEMTNPRLRRGSASLETSDKAGSEAFDARTASIDELREKIEQAYGGKLENASFGNDLKIRIEDGKNPQSEKELMQMWISQREKVLAAAKAQRKNPDNALKEVDAIYSRALDLFRSNENIFETKGGAVKPYSLDLETPSPMELIVSSLPGFENAANAPGAKIFSPLSPLAEIGLERGMKSPAGAIGTVLGVTGGIVAGTLAGEPSAPAKTTLSPNSPVLEFGPNGEEIYYRTMSAEHAEYLQQNGTLLPTGETSISPLLSFSASGNYKGITVKLTTAPGTSARLQEIGIAANAPAAEYFPNMSTRTGPWSETNVRFKFETYQMTTQLGRGAGLDIFNKNLIGYEILYNKAK